MLEKLKGIGTHVANKATDAVGGVTSSVKEGVGALNEKAVRASTAQMCSILEIALDELKSRPLSERPVTLKTTVNIGIAALEMEIQLPPTTKENK